MISSVFIDYGLIKNIEVGKSNDRYDYRLFVIMDGLIYCIHSYAETAAVTQVKATTRLLRHNTPISLIKRNNIYPFPLFSKPKNAYHIPFIYNPLHKK